MSAHFEVIKGKKRGYTFKVVEGQRAVLGRDISSDIQLFDMGISRTHLMVEYSPDGSISLTDLNSSNGSYVNGRRVIRATIDFGDIIQIGGAQIRYLEKPPASDVDEDVLADLVSDFFDDGEKKQIKKRFEIDDSGLIDLSNVEEVAEQNEKVQQSLQTIYKVGNLINAVEELDDLFDTIMDTIYNVFEADRSFLIMKNEDTGLLEPAVVRKGHKDSQQPGKIHVSTTIVGETYKSGVSILTQDAMSDDRFKEGESIVMNNIRSVMCVPVETRDEILGLIYVDTVSFSGAFTESDLELLTAVGKQAGIAIRRAKLIDDLGKMFYSTITTLIATIEAKDQYTRGHSERVTHYALVLGEELALDREKMDVLKLAGLLHDIGKIGIPESILNKPSRLTKEEFDIIKGHPAVGSNIIRNMAKLDEVSDIVLSHHEQWGGNGYPDKKTGDEIPILARILAIADSYDAMTSKRPYRDGLEEKKVLAEFENCSGTQFDESLARIFIEMIQDARIKPMETKRIELLLS
ncbi:MAG: HD domain-containing protein [Planctomycetota bacterium]|nr:MAG: HD domain-containing protein [Planctomycetota bacterium]